MIETGKIDTPMTNIHDRLNVLAWYRHFNKKCWAQASPHNEIINGFGNKGNNKITELRTILQRESQNS